MATLSFRLPAHRQPELAMRHAAWSRCAAPIKAPVSSSRRGGLALVTEVLELQPPTGPSMIEVSGVPGTLAIKGAATAAVAVAVANDVAATGWFDSTWDLQQGLEISEGLPADLPLGDWLKMYLAA